MLPQVKVKLKLHYQNHHELKSYFQNLRNFVIFKNANSLKNPQRFPKLIDESLEHKMYIVASVEISFVFAPPLLTKMKLAGSWPGALCYSYYEWPCPYVLFKSIFVSILQMGRACKIFVAHGKCIDEQAKNRNISESFRMFSLITKNNF